MIIYYDQLATAIKQQPKSCYFIYGQPVNLAIDAKNIIIEHAKKYDYSIEQYFADLNFNSQHLLQEVDNLSLFNNKKVLVINLSTPKIPKSIDEFLTLFFTINPPDIKVVIVATMTKKADINKKVYQLVEQQGVFVPIYELTPWQLLPWLNKQITTRSLSLEAPLQKYILQNINESTEAAIQILDKLYLCHGTATITKQDIQLEFSSEIDGDIYTLIDLILQQQTKQALDLLNKLVTSNVEINIIIWQISTMLYNLLILTTQHNLQTIPKQIPAFKKKLYTQAAKDYSSTIIKLAIEKIHIADRKSKGLLQGEPAIDIEQVMIMLGNHAIE